MSCGTAARPRPPAAPCGSRSGSRWRSHLVRGRIDRVDPGPEDGIILLDYKTARYPASEEEAERSLQLAIYYLAALRDPELAALGRPVEMQLVYPARIMNGRFARVSQHPGPDHASKVEQRLLALLDGAAAESLRPRPARRLPHVPLQAHLPHVAPGRGVPGPGPSPSGLSPTGTPPPARRPGTGVASGEPDPHRCGAPGVRAALRGQDPTPEQLAAITAPIGPVHVIAGAGSGKTAVMAARIVYLVERLGVAPASVLGLTFTNKAASELEARVRDALADIPIDVGDEITVDTYHAFAADLVKAYGIRVGVEVDADLLSEAQQYQILLGILDSERFEHLSVRTAGATIRKTLEPASACADHVVPAERVVEASRRLLQRADEGERLPDWMLQAARSGSSWPAWSSATAEKRRRGRLDFGDQVAKAVELVEGHPELREELRTRFQHVLLDEYQDTNVGPAPPDAADLPARRLDHGRRRPPGHLRLPRRHHVQPPLVRRPLPGHRRAPVCPRQSPSPPPARGRSPSLRRGGLAAAVDQLPVGPPILALANSVIDRIPEERRRTALVARPGARRRGLRAALLADQFAEAAGRRPGRAGPRDRPARRHLAGVADVAVLVRSKRLGPLREALEQRGVPVEVGPVRPAGDPRDRRPRLDPAGGRRPRGQRRPGPAAPRPRWRIGHRHLVRLARWAARNNWGLKDELPGEDPDPGDGSLALDHLDEVEGLDEEARRRLDAFCEELRELRAAARGPLLDLVQTILERTGVWAELEASGDRRAVTARQNLATFLDRVAAFAPVQGDLSPAAFLVYLDAVEDA